MLLALRSVDEVSGASEAAERTIVVVDRAPRNAPVAASSPVVARLANTATATTSATSERRMGGRPRGGRSSRPGGGGRAGRPGPPLSAGGGGGGARGVGTVAVPSAPLSAVAGSIVRARASGS